MYATISAKHNINTYLNLLCYNGTLEAVLS